VSDLIEMDLAGMRAGLDRGEFSSEELAMAHLDQITKVDSRVRAFLHVDTAGALDAARRFDEARAHRDPSPAVKRPLAGIPLALKDILCTRDMPTTCGSRLLEGYVPPYDATLVHRLRRSGAVLLGKTNLDEFGMGSSCENSGFGPTRNPLDPERVPGGSSGGTAAAIAAREAPGGFGTDTGGSVRQPAAYCGLVGLKPTYGRISRYGLIAYASSLDQAGPMARSVEDAATLLEAVWGHDPMDATSSPEPPPALRGNHGLEGLRFGLPAEYLGAGVEEGVTVAVRSTVAAIQEAGGEVREIRLPLTEVVIPTYYLIATAEASANLARYDGIRFGRRRGGERPELDDVYERTRAEGLGREVQRRILLGTYGLSAGYYDAYYLRAQKVRTLIRRQFSEAFESVDLILGPTTPDVAYRLGDKIRDPLAMYLGDVFTVPASLAGLPALSLPCGASRGLPVGLQLVGNHFREDLVLRAARGIETVLALAPFCPAVGA
jgi:aspartyl-tRNA(Asn)/glutamyl-tRNA(Gln) amidotransferase subunit A